MICLFFFFNESATTEIYTLSLHDALPILTPRPDDERLRVDRRRQRGLDAQRPDRLLRLRRVDERRADADPRDATERGDSHARQHALPRDALRHEVGAPRPEVRREGQRVGVEAESQRVPAPPGLEKAGKAHVPRVAGANPPLVARPPEVQPAPVGAGEGVAAPLDVDDLLSPRTAARDQ